jgi:hypothetical protein
VWIFTQIFRIHFNWKLFIWNLETNKIIIKNGYRTQNLKFCDPRPNFFLFFLKFLLTIRHFSWFSLRKNWIELFRLLELKIYVAHYIIISLISSNNIFCPIFYSWWHVKLYISQNLNWAYYFIFSPLSLFEFVYLLKLWKLKVISKVFGS